MTRYIRKVVVKVGEEKPDVYEVGFPSPEGDMIEKITARRKQNDDMIVSVWAGPARKLCDFEGWPMQIFWEYEEEKGA